MRSVQFDRFGNATEVLTVVEDVPIPEPGDGEVRIRVTARPIHPADIMFVRGTYGLKPSLPASPGFEGAGTVDSAGPGIDLKPGQRVMFAGTGTWQEYVIVPSYSVFRVPEGIPDEIACQSFVNPFTAMAMLEELDLPAGSWLMQTAGASAIGQIIIELANQQGIKTICTVRRYDQIAKLKKLGATAVIDTENEHILERVPEITNHEGVQGILDAVGGKIAGQALGCLAQHGTMITFGSLSREETPVSNRDMIFKGLTIKGFWLAQWVHEAEKSRIREAFDTVIKMMTSGRYAPQIETTYDLAEIEDAVLDAQSPGRSGKVVLVG